MKWAIVRKSEHSANVEAIYESASNQQAKYAGRWGDDRMYVHLLVPENLENKDKGELEARHEAVMVGCIGVPKLDAEGNQIVEKVYDDEGNPVLGSDGNQLELPEYEQDHVYESQYVIREKN